MNYLLFIVTFFPISLMPGINMTYAMSIGMSLGYVRALPMMAGQLASLAFVGMLGVGAVLAHYSFAFKVLNIIAGLYLLYLGAMLFFSKGQLSITKVTQLPSKKQMFLNGAVVCISNPKAWIFLSALLPTFLDANDPFSLPRIFSITVMLVFIEFCSLSLYALGGAILKKFLQTHLRLLEIFTAAIICVIGILMMLR